MSEPLIGNCRLIDLTVLGDARGSLVAIEQGRDVSFNIRRVYYLFGTTPGVDRGFHAHHNLTQLAVAVAGGCTMILDDGSRRVEMRLDEPAKGLLIGSHIWREMTDFTDDCVLMVLADAPYDEADYVRDYDEFLTLARA